MVRNLRDLAGFTKVHLAPGQSSVVEVPLRLCDLARYDEDASWTNRKAAAVTGAYVVDGGDWRYGSYRCQDDTFVSIALLQGKFLRAFVQKTGIDFTDLGDPGDREYWPEFRRRMEELFSSRTRDEWTEFFDGPDDNVHPVLYLVEAHDSPQNRDRDAFVDVEGTQQPAPAPRFSRTASEIARPAPRPGEGGAAALSEWGFDQSTIDSLADQGLLD